MYSTGGKKSEGGINRRTLSIASGLKQADDVFSNVSRQRNNNQYKYKKIDRNFKGNNTLTGTATNYEYDAFKKDGDGFNVVGNGLYDFLKKTQNVSTPKSQTSYQAAFGMTPSQRAGAGGGDGSAYAYSRTGSNIDRKPGTAASNKRPVSQEGDMKLTAF